MGVLGVVATQDETSVDTLSDADLLVAILTELRTLNAMVAAIGAGQSTTSNPDDFRAEIDAVSEFGAS